MFLPNLRSISVMRPGLAVLQFICFWDLEPQIHRLSSSSPTWPTSRKHHRSKNKMCNFDATITESWGERKGHLVPFSRVHRRQDFLLSMLFKLVWQEARQTPKRQGFFSLEPSGSLEIENAKNKKQGKISARKEHGNPRKQRHCQ